MSIHRQLVNEFTSSTGEKFEHLALRTQVSNPLSAAFLTDFDLRLRGNQQPSFDRSTCARAHRARVGE